MCRCEKCGGNLLTEEGGQVCLQCGWRPSEASPPSQGEVNIRRPTAKAIVREMVKLTKRVVVVSPTEPDKDQRKPIELAGFGYISKTGCWYCNRPGRGRTGEYRYCKSCGKQIYVKGYRIKKGMGNFCGQCSKKEQATSVRFALMGLAAHSSRFTPHEMLERAGNILIKHLGKDKEQTFADLVNSPTFTSDDLLWNAFSIVIEQSLRIDPRFEEVGGGIWKLRKA